MCVARVEDGGQDWGVSEQMKGVVEDWSEKRVGKNRVTGRISRDGVATGERGTKWETENTADWTLRCLINQERGNENMLHSYDEKAVVFRIERKILTYEDKGDDEDEHSFINRNEVSVRAGNMQLSMEARP